MYFRDENLRISLLFTLLDSRFVGLSGAVVLLARIGVFAVRSS